MKSIDFTKAIASGAVTFEQAVALQGCTMTEAIREGIVTFEEACQLQGIAAEAANSKPKKAPKQKAPKAPEKAPKQAKKAEAPKVEAPKAEEPPKEPVYTKGGCILQWNDGIAAKGKEKAKISKAVKALEAQGFTVERKRCGTWVQLYQAKGEKRPCAEFAAAKLDKGWQLIKGAWTYVDLLKGYEDCFKPEA